jgi:hypothetical protein
MNKAMQDKFEETVKNDDPYDSFGEKKELIEGLFEKTEDYIKSNIELMKLKTLETASDIFAALLANIFILLLCLFFFLLLNFGVSYWVGSILGSLYLGFWIVGGFYTLLTILLYQYRDRWLIPMIKNSVISQILKEKPDERTDSE